MKIWLYIMLTVIAILLVVGIALEIFFRHYVANETLRNATRDTTYAADAFSDAYHRSLIPIGRRLRGIYFISLNLSWHH